MHEKRINVLNKIYKNYFLCYIYIYIEFEYEYNEIHLNFDFKKKIQLNFYSLTMFWILPMGYMHCFKNRPEMIGSTRNQTLNWFNKIQKPAKNPGTSHFSVI